MTLEKFHSMIKIMKNVCHLPLSFGCKKSSGLDFECVNMFLAFSVQWRSYRRRSRKEVSYVCPQMVQAWTQEPFRLLTLHRIIIPLPVCYVICFTLLSCTSSFKDRVNLETKELKWEHWMIIFSENGINLAVNWFLPFLCEKMGRRYINGLVN